MYYVFQRCTEVMSTKMVCIQVFLPLYDGPSAGEVDGVPTELLLAVRKPNRSIDVVVVQDLPGSGDK